MFYYRFGINKVKLQHAAGYPPLSVECDYTSTGICQHPLLHDLDGKSTSPIIFELGGVDSSYLNTSDWRQFNTKSQAMNSAAIIKSYKTKISGKVRVTTITVRVGNGRKNSILSYSYPQL